MSRIAHYSITENAPVMRSYTMDTEACESAVRLARQGRVAADIETDGLAEESYTVKVITISDDRHVACLDAFNPKHREAARDAFELAPEIVFHNSAYDIPPLANCGAMTLDQIDKVTDTLIWARMAMSDKLGGKGLEDLEKLLLDGPPEKDRFKQWYTINKYSKAEAFKRATYLDRGYTMYAGHDTIVTARIYEPLKQMVLDLFTDHPFGDFGADASLAEELLWREQIINRMMLRRSARGLGVDLDLLQREQDRIADVQGDLAHQMREFGIESPTNANHLIAVLEKDDAIPDSYPRTEKRNVPSTAGDDLEKLDHPAAKLYGEYGEHNKLFQYLENARVIAERTDGRLHPVVGIMAAVTGRMSYSNPALQQFTVPAREAVVADDGDRLVSLDWSQIEPVVAANLAGDTTALEVYEKSGDLYQAAVVAGGVTRDQGKVVILAGMFGQGLRALMGNLKLDSLEETEEVREKVNLGMPGTGNLIGWAGEWGRETGMTFTMSGRIVKVPERFSYRATNFTIQGSAYDILAEVLVEMKRRGLEDFMFLSFHDENIVSEKVAQEVEEIMCTPPPRLVELTGRVPVLRVDSAHLGDRWRTPPKKNPCSSPGCALDSRLRWAEDRWYCGQH